MLCRLRELLRSEQAYLDWSDNAQKQHMIWQINQQTSLRIQDASLPIVSPKAGWDKRQFHVPSKHVAPKSFTEHTMCLLKLNQGECWECWRERLFLHIGVNKDKPKCANTDMTLQADMLKNVWLRILTGTGKNFWFAQSAYNCKSGVCTFFLACKVFKTLRHRSLMVMVHKPNLNGKLSLCMFVLCHIDFNEMLKQHS